MEEEWLLIISTVVTLVVALALVRERRMRAGSKRKGMPAPGPRGWPVFGHLHLLSRLPHQDLFKLSKVHGPLMGMRLGSVPLLVASSPEMAKQILQTHDAIFAGRPRTAVRVYTSNGLKDIIWADPSPYWRLMRQICVTDLFSNKRLHFFGSGRSQEVGALIQSVLEESVPSRAHILSAHPCFMRPKLECTANNIIARMVLGKPLDGTLVDQKNIIHLLSQVFHLGSQLNFGDYIPFLKWGDFQGLARQGKVVAKELFSALQEIVDQRRHERTNLSDYSPKDFLDLLIDASVSSNGEITDEHVIAVLKDMFLAGTDSSATVVEWVLAQLLTNPQKLEEVQTEIDRVVGKERMVQETDIPHLPYLDACLKETMRLRPPAPLLVPHKSLEACDIHGFEVPAQSITYINVWAIGRDASVWENPLEFCPERFLSTSINYMQASQFQLLPFGYGRRGCPGWRLGLINVQIILASLLHCFEWIPTETFDLSESFGVALRKATPLAAFAIPRLPKHVY